MKIWVTGCAGFLGSRLVARLAAADHCVVGFSRTPAPDLGTAVVVDLASDRAYEALLAVIDGLGVPDVVIHAAARQPGSNRLAEYVNANVVTTANLLDALSVCRPRQLIYTSTTSVYGVPLDNPVCERAPTSPHSPYAATKLAAEHLCSQFEGSTVILRLPSLYGAGQCDSLIDGLARFAIRGEVIELYGNGDRIRDALHVDDVVILGVLDDPPGAGFSCFNLGPGRAISTFEYADALVVALKSRSLLLRVERPSTTGFDLYVDIAKARREIGFSPSPLSQSMKRYADELQP